MTCTTKPKCGAGPRLGKVLSIKQIEDKTRWKYFNERKLNQIDSSAIRVWVFVMTYGNGRWKSIVAHADKSSHPPLVHGFSFPLFQQLECFSGIYQNWVFWKVGSDCWISHGALSHSVSLLQWILIKLTSLLILFAQTSGPWKQLREEKNL